SGIQKDAQKPFFGVVIESLLDKRRGVIASLVIKQGTFRTGEKLFRFEKEDGKAEALFDTKLSPIKQAVAGEAVEIIGLTEVLPAGSLLFTTQQEQEAIVREAVSAPKKIDVSSFFETEKSSVSVILKTQTAGELEAIKQ